MKKKQVWNYAQCRLTPELRVYLDDMARQSRRSRASTMRVLIEEAISTRREAAKSSRGKR